MKRVLDWIDWFTDGDRMAVRVLLAVALFWVAAFAVDWGWGKLHPEEDVFCKAYPSSVLCLDLSADERRALNERWVTDTIVNDIFREVENERR